MENGYQEKVIDAFLGRHPDLKPGLRGDAEIDWMDQVSGLYYPCTFIILSYNCYGKLS